MALLDNKGRIFGKINVIDILVFLMIIAVVGAAGMYYLKVNAQRNVNKIGDNKLIVYDIELKNMLPEVADSIKKGEKITDDVKGVVLGTVKDIRDKKPNEELLENTLEGTYNVSQSPSRFQQIISVEASAKLSNDIFKIGEFDIKTGRSIAIKGKDYVAVGYIISVRNLQ